MDSSLATFIVSRANKEGLDVRREFAVGLDQYIEKYHSKETEGDKLVIQAYLARAAMRIAMTEGKRSLGFDDAKAAIWLFHQPTDPNDSCAEAGKFALRNEGVRKKQKRSNPGRIGHTFTGPLLNEAFAQYLDSREDKGWRKIFET